MKPNINIKKVLIAPLDWGLGHATRCIPIIEAFLKLGWEVIIAADGAPAALLKEQFPDLSFIYLEGYKIRYTQKKSLLVFKLVFQIPRLLKKIRTEKSWLAKTINEHKIDLVISDNRYGLSAEQCLSVFITHQLLIKTPFKFTDHLLQKINYHFINKFSICWVPDMKGKGIAGELSHPQKMPAIPVEYMNPISRFKKSSMPIEFDICFSISGPEPQRTILENIICNQLKTINGKFVVLRGLPGNAVRPHSFSKEVTVYNHLPTKALNELFLKSKVIVCRSGYTTVMEIMSLGKKALLIPTPGQTEQEYLAAYLNKQSFALSANQSSLQLTDSIKTLNNVQLKQPVIDEFNITLLEQLLNNLFAQHNNA